MEAYHNTITGDSHKQTVVNGFDQYLGRTPLHWAAFFGAEDSIRSLITCGADVDAGDKLCGMI